MGQLARNGGSVWSGIRNNVEVRVQDEGLGIAQEDIAKLFDRYYRVENSQTENIPGYGIGLYLCAQIIQHHKGKIWVESKPGKGSEFFFSLPIKGEKPESFAIN